MATTAAKAFDEFKERLKLTVAQRALGNLRRDATGGLCKYSLSNSGGHATHPYKIDRLRMKRVYSRYLKSFHLKVMVNLRIDNGD